MGVGGRMMAENFSTGDEAAGAGQAGDREEGEGL